MKEILALGSTSVLETDALREACETARLDVEVVVCAADSGVAMQPVGREEIARGAHNRAVDARNIVPDSYGVGIEYGVVRHGGRWTDVAMVAISHPDGHESSRWSYYFALPTAAVEKALAIGVDKTTVGAVIAQDQGGQADPHFILSAGKESRKDFLVDALVGALKETFNEKLRMQHGDTHRISVGGVVRELPIKEVSPGVSVAYFDIRGDWQLTEAAGSALAGRLPRSTEALVMPDGKATALLHVMGRASRLPTIVCPKEHDPLMVEPVLTCPYKSIAVRRAQNLYLPADAAAKIRGKKVIVVDDVVSTGGTLKAVFGLMAAAKAEVIGIAVIFTEGDAVTEVISLGSLPLFKKE